MGENLIEDNNFIVLQGFMINKLKLSGTDLIVYACIYGFSQEENSWFTGSANYLAKWANVSRRCVMASLKKLTDLKLIEKKNVETNGVRYCNYRTCAGNFIGYEEFSQGGMKNFHRGYEEFSHHNIEHNIDTYIESDNFSDKENYDFIAEAENAKLKLEAKELLQRLNEKSGSQYKENDRNFDMIRPRLKEYPVEDLLMMIDYMCDKWNGTEFERFLRPATLFCASKCEGYVEEARRNMKERDNTKYKSLTYKDVLIKSKELYGTQSDDFISTANEIINQCIELYGLDSDKYEEIVRFINELSSN